MAHHRAGHLLPTICSRRAGVRIRPHRGNAGGTIPLTRIGTTIRHTLESRGSTGWLQRMLRWHPMQVLSNSQLGGLWPSEAHLVANGFAVRYLGLRTASTCVQW